MATTIGFQQVKVKVQELKAKGMSDEMIATFFATMDVKIRKTDVDIEREAVESLADDVILNVMAWFANVPYKSKWSFTMAIYRRHWSFEKVSKEFTSSDGEKRLITDKVYKPTANELLKSWSIMKDKDIARNVYKDYAKDNATTLQGDERYSNSVALPNTRGGQVD